MFRWLGLLFVAIHMAACSGVQCQKYCEKLKECNPNKFADTTSCVHRCDEAVRADRTGIFSGYAACLQEHSCTDVEAGKHCSAPTL